jgi:membrane protease YdiL (CAAX protease family)
VLPPVDSAADSKPWRAIDALYLLFFWIAGAIASGPFIGADEISVFELFGIIAPFQAAGIFIGTAVLARNRQPWRAALGVGVAPQDWRGVLEGIGLQFGLSILIALVVGLFGGTLPSQEIVDDAELAVGGLERVAVVIALVVLAPISEELVFRGVLLRGLATRYGMKAAVFGSSVAFALLHLLDPNLLPAMPVFLALGVALGYSVSRTGRLGRAIAFHAGFNLVTVVAVLFL